MSELPRRLRVYSFIWRRRHIFVALAVFVIVWGAIHIMYSALQQRPIIVATHTINPGQTITAGDVEQRRVAALNLPATTLGASSQVVGHRATSTVKPGDLFVHQMVTGRTDPHTDNNHSVIAVAIDKTSATAIDQGSNVVFHIDDKHIHARVIALYTDGDSSMFDDQHASIIHIAVKNTDVETVVHAAQEKPLYAVASM